MLLVVRRTLSAELRRHLNSKGWTPYKLSQESKVPRSQLSVYLSGETIPKDETIRAMASAFGIDPEPLVALADIERLGEERLARLRLHAAEELLGEESESGVRPWSPKEAAYIATIERLGGEVPGTVRRQPKAERLAILKAMAARRSAAPKTENEHEEEG